MRSLLSSKWVMSIVSLHTRWFQWRLVGVAVLSRCSRGLSVNRKSLAKMSPASDVLVPGMGLMDPKYFCSGTRPNMPMETGDNHAISLRPDFRLMLSGPC
ncbi:unnamed protein product [Prunus armeniaca]